jgi:hypothetical protein
VNLIFTVNAGTTGDTASITIRESIMDGNWKEVGETNVNVAIESDTVQLAAPTGVKLSAGGATSLSVTWDEVENASGYVIEYATNASFTDVQAVPALDTTAILGELTPDTTYYIWAKSQRLVGQFL